MKTLGERLFFFRSSHLNITQPAFCEKCNSIEKSSVSQQNLSQWEKNLGKPSMKKMRVILKAFPELNREWLETGEGNMIKTHKTLIDVYKESNPDKKDEVDYWKDKYIALLEKYNNLK